jgi:ankyrin repeat protein
MILISIFFRFIKKKIIKMEILTYIEKGDLKSTSDLLKEGKIEINFAREETGDSLLHIAAYFNKTSEIIKHLLSLGADPNKKNINGSLPLHYAIQQGNNLVAFELINNVKSNLNLVDSLGRTPLALAIIQKNETATLNILKSKQKINLNVKDNNGYDIVILSILSKVVKLFEEVIKYGGNVDTTDNDGNTPLMISVINKDVPMIKSICSHKLKINAMNKLNDTALHYSVSNGDDFIDITNLILKHGKTLTKKTDVDINIRGNNGMTPLMLTASLPQKNKLTIAKLLKYNVNKKLMNNLGKTAQDLAIENKNVDIAKLLSTK